MNEPTEPSDNVAVHWDVALESLLLEHYRQQQKALDIGQLHGLGERYSIRLDDLLDTLCKLVTHGVWCYFDRHGEAVDPDGDMCRLLAANHRLNPVQLDRLRGRWQPLAEASPVA